MLLENGADANKRCKADGKTPLMFACKGGNSSCVTRLLESGADILAFDWMNGRTCLHVACRNGQYDCVIKILDAARDGPISNTWGFARFVNVRDDNGAIPLHMASRSGDVRIVRTLLNNGALVTATTCNSTYGPGHGSTPLHSAARGGSLECVEELLAWGADRTQKDLMGQTAYLVAAQRGHYACAAILNPNAAEPMVWPSPLKFMNDLEPEARIILEAALAEANAARKRQSNSSCEQSDLTTTVPDNDREQLEVRGAAETCSICFENACSIEVKDCGHRMCAYCTVALCCHNKPNPHIQQPCSSPAPSCPFCRTKIGRLTLVSWKSKLVSEDGNSCCRDIEDEDDRDTASKKKSMMSRSSSLRSSRRNRVGVYN